MALVQDYIKNCYIEQCLESKCGWSTMHTKSKDGETYLWRMKEGREQIVVIANAALRYSYQRNQAELRWNAVHSRFPEIKREDCLFIIAGDSRALGSRGLNVIGLNTGSGKARFHTGSGFVKEKVALKEMFEERINKDKLDSYKIYGSVEKNHSVIAVWLLLAIMVLIYLFGNKNGQYNLLIKSFASGVIYNNSELYRYVTYMFFHAGIVHLIGNVLSMIYIGSIYEKRKGSVDALIVFFTGGIIAAYASIALAQYTGIIYTVGASGGIFALLGAMAYDLMTSDDMKGRRSGVVKYVIITILASSISGKTDIVCHIGGFIYGIGYGFITQSFDEYKTYSRAKKISREKKKETIYEYSTACRGDSIIVSK